MRFTILGLSWTLGSPLTSRRIPLTVTATGTLWLLEAVRDHNDRGKRNVRFYQAGSSEMSGRQPPQDENTPFYPRNPYAVSKVAADW